MGSCPTGRKKNNYKYIRSCCSGKNCKIDRLGEVKDGRRHVVYILNGKYIDILNITNGRVQWGFIKFEFILCVFSYIKYICRIFYVRKWW